MKGDKTAQLISHGLCPKCERKEYDALDRKPARITENESIRHVVAVVAGILAALLISIAAGELCYRVQLSHHIHGRHTMRGPNTTTGRN